MSRCGRCSTGRSDYTLAMQHPITGGWRYAAGDRGDTSQLGWQVMALAAARNAGPGWFRGSRGPGPWRFSTSVSSGTAGGLAAYRPGERPSVAMTAEALFCRLLLGMPADHPAAAEAIALLAGSHPSSSTYNIYTWYYATLASFHAGGPQWEAWNAAAAGGPPAAAARAGGPLDGSWDPDAVWGRPRRPRLCHGPRSAHPRGLLPLPADARPLSPGWPPHPELRMAARRPAASHRRNRHDRQRCRPAGCLNAGVAAGIDLSVIGRSPLSRTVTRRRIRPWLPVSRCLALARRNC